MANGEVGGREEALYDSPPPEGMGCLSLTVLGGIAEVLGLVLIALELTLVQRREFPGRGPLARLLRWLQRLRARLGRQKAAMGIASISGGGSVSASGSARVETAPQTLEGRVERLERQHTELEQRMTGLAEEVARRANELQQKLAEQREELGGRIDQLEQERLQHLEQSLRLQWPGILLFVVGVVLSVAGNAFPSSASVCPSASVGGLLGVGVLAAAGLVFWISLRRRSASER